MDGACAWRRELALALAACRFATVARRGVWGGVLADPAPVSFAGRGVQPLWMHFCFALLHVTQATGFRIADVGVEA